MVSVPEAVKHFITYMCKNFVSLYYFSQATSLPRSVWLSGRVGVSSSSHHKSCRMISHEVAALHRMSAVLSLTRLTRPSATMPTVRWVESHNSFNHSVQEIACHLMISWMLLSKVVFLFRLCENLPKWREDSECLPSVLPQATTSRYMVHLHIISVYCQRGKDWDTARRKMITPELCMMEGGGGGSS